MMRNKQSLTRASVIVVSATLASLLYAGAHPTITTAANPKNTDLMKDRQEQLAAERISALIKERFQAAQTEWDSRFRNCQVGLCTLDFLLRSSRRLLHAQLELEEFKTNRLAALRKHLDRMNAAQKMYLSRFKAGTVAREELAEATYYRAEAALLVVRESIRQNAEAKEKVNALLKERYEAAKVECDARYKEFQTGRGTLDFLLRSSHRLLEARLDISKSNADRTEALKEHLEQTQSVDKANRDQFNRGLLAQQDLMESTYYRVAAALAGEQEKARLGKPVKDKLQSLMKELYEAASAECADRTKEAQAGRGTLVFLMDSSYRLLKAQLDLSESTQGRLIAFERQLQRMSIAEQTNRDRYKAGRVSIKEWAICTYYRADAAILLEREKLKR